MKYFLLFLSAEAPTKFAKTSASCFDDTKPVTTAATAATAAAAAEHFQQ